MPLIDVYDRYQDITNFRAVVGFAEYVYVKGTHGAGIPAGGGRSWPADGFVRGLKAQGARVGLYCYALPSSSPEAQADFLAKEVKRLGATGLPPALDLEEPGTVHTAFAQRFLKHLKSHGFSRVTLYANASSMRSLNPQSWNMPGLVIWCASYTHPPSHYYSGKVHIHQYTDRGRVPGIPGNVDINNILDSSFLSGSVEDDLPYRDWPQADKDAMRRDFWSWNTGNAWGKDKDGTPWNEPAYKTLQTMEKRFYTHITNAKREMLNAVAGVLAAVQAESGMTPERLQEIVRDALADELVITGSVEISNRDQAA